MGKKVIIVGIDGGTFTLIDRFIEEGKLPFFRFLKENSIYSFMDSVDQDTRVPISPTIWTSLATGKSAEKHKILSFFNLEQDIQSARLFEILNHYGLTVGTFGWELTWPPEDYGGFTIPCSMARDNRTFPSYLSPIMELRGKKKGNFFKNIILFIKLKKIGVDFSTLLQLSLNTIFEKFYDKKIKLFKRLILLNRTNLSLFLNLIKKYNTDISFFFIPLSDSSAHYFWKYWDKENFPEVSENERKKYKDLLLKAYIEIDESLRKIYERCKDHSLFIISDHGMKPIREGSFKTLSLKQKSFLEKTNLSGKVEIYFVGLNSVIVIKDGSGVDKENLIRFFKNIIIKPSGERFFEVVEMDESGRIFLKVTQLDKGKFKEEDFADMKVLIGTEYFDFLSLVDINDIERSADHDKTGIFIIYDKDLKFKGKVDNSTIYDFLPTLLSYLNLPIAKDFDGKSVYDFSKKVEIDTYDFLVKRKKEEVKRDDEFVKEELRRLGYLKDKG
uniref:Phosphodiesterase n=1 Tax=candidate division WOR-3 bacterium TaxID=2052148 RepID=A0A7C3N8E7_UNCW3